MTFAQRLARPLFAKLSRPSLDRFVAAQASTGWTLDIGAQTGPYARHFPRRLALDVVWRPGVQVVGDAQAIGLADGTFDVVLCTEVLEHVPEPQRAVDEMFRVLKPGGRLILTTRFCFPIHDAPHDYFRFTKYGLRHLLQAFEIEELREETTTVGTLAVLTQRLGLQTEPPGARILRAGWLVAAQLMRPWSFLVKREYGDTAGRAPERGIMTSGYHVRCRKPLPARP